MALVEDGGMNDVKAVRTLASRYLAFVSHAFNPDCERFRNFMSYSRQWTEECGSEDSHGRALWALGAVVGRSLDPGRQSLGRHLFHAALPALERFTSPRAWAFALLGMNEYLRAGQGDRDVWSVHETLAGRLLALFDRTSRPEWPWLEDRLTYSNAQLSQALIAAGSRMDCAKMTAAGLRSLGWLAEIQRSADGYFAPVGTDGFYVRGETKASFDQQPVEACAMVSACLEAQRATGDARWSEHAKSAFSWFLGQNQLKQSVYDPATGGCRDGLPADRVNQNQGAESTLSYLLAAVEMRSTDRARAERTAVGEAAE
jgi:hypothetical protein